MIEHTKEPWRTDAPSGFPGDVMAGKEMIARTTITEQSNAKANARRIVACVNACQGIPTDELERKGLPLYMHETFTEQRDELLAALKDMDRAYMLLLENGRDRILFLGGECDEVPVMESGDPYLRQARATIAKVKP